MPAYWNLDERPDLPVWPFPAFEPLAAPELESTVRPRSRSSGRLGAVAVAIGLALGGLAFAYWKLQPRQVIVASTPPPTVAVVSPRPEQFWTPTTAAELEQLLETARVWLRMTPAADDRDLTRVVWAFHWRVPFPSLADVVARPAAAEAVELVRRVVAAARAEQAEPEPEPFEPVATATVPSSTRREDQHEADDDETPIRNEPTPGYFYFVRRDDLLEGEDGIAARALHRAVLSAAERKGWHSDKAENRATKVARKPTAQADYATLIEQAEWNGEYAGSLAEGTLLWLPPIRRGRLLDRNRRRQVVLDERILPDGSSECSRAVLREPVRQLEDRQAAIF